MVRRENRRASGCPGEGGTDDRGVIAGWPAHAGSGYGKGGRKQMGMITDWPTLAACQDGDPDALFVQGAEQNVAKRICRSCPVRYECLADALDNRIEFGVWGGMTERERRALLRRHPQVASWRKMFEAAMRNKDKALVSN
jgi:WhiB family redox-sensing transcriptional regulator